ncbi:MAG: hypothetical protein LBN19_02355 [Endomicrobium sp.]|nr:hypothetical protein [Endomicrobium sp.]
MTPFEDSIFRGGDKRCFFMLMPSSEHETSTVPLVNFNFLFDASEIKKSSELPAVKERVLSIMPTLMFSCTSSNAYILQHKKKKINIDKTLILI